MKNLNRLYEIKNLVPTPPIYIMAPGYDHKISGIVVLHYLCHYFNEIGVECFLHTNLTAGFLNTPVLTQEIYNRHIESGQNTIAVYPEIYIDNPLQAKNVVRFLLNKPGERPWINSMPDIMKFWHSPDRKKEFILHFADEFQVEYLESKRLYIPAVNRKYYFEQIESKAKRDGFIIYSNRVKIELTDLPAWIRDCTVVSMENPRTPADLGELYRQSEALILAERTGAHLEALVSGCPVLIIPNERFQTIPSFSMFGNLGTGWGLTNDQLAWAKMTTNVFQSVYQGYESSFHVELTERLLDIVRFFFGRR